MRLNAYIDARLERWGCWRIGSKVSVAPWARLRYGSPTEVTDPPPRDEERETDALVLLLHAAERRFLLLLYPTQRRSYVAIAERHKCSISTVYSTLARLQNEVARMIEQRRRGEPLDPKRRPIRSKALPIKINDRYVASVVP